MYKRSAVITVLVALAMVLPAMSFVASDADADTDDVATYNRDHLDNLRQKMIYDAFFDLLMDSSGLPVNDEALGSPGEHYYEVPVDGFSWVIDGVSDETLILEILKEDAEAALLATRLDNPYAVWMWTSATYMPEITVTRLLDSIMVKVAVEDIFATGLIQMVTDAKAKVAEITVSGSNDAEKSKNVNSAVVKYGYTDDFTKDPYARTVYSLVPADGSHKLSSEGASALFKALCDSASVKCIQVGGKLIDGTKKLDWQWNYVSIDNSWFAYDSGYNAKYSNSEAWVAAGVYSTADGKTFGVIHSALMPSGNLMLSYYGYSWPTSEDIWETVTEYMPWVLIGVICIVLSVVLVMMARKGE